MMRTINLDMDGVVADFNTYVGNILGREVGWEGRDLTDEEWGVLTQVHNLYFHLPLITESVELVSLAKEYSKKNEVRVRFLTAIPRRTTIATAEQDKRNWVEKYFPGIPMEIGPYSKHKQNWCNPLDILVDDKQSNCWEWFYKGGISVYHVGNWKETLENFIKALTTTTPTFFGPVAQLVRAGDS